MVQVTGGELFSGARRTGESTDDGISSQIATIAAIKEMRNACAGAAGPSLCVCSLA